MYSRRATLLVPGSYDLTPLRSFADTIYYNPMYETVVSQLRTSPGFVKKSHSLVEAIDQSYLISEIVFDTKENFDLYASDPAIMSMWEYLIALAKETNIQTEIVDSEKILDL